MRYGSVIVSVLILGLALVSSAPARAEPATILVYPIGGADGGEDQADLGHALVQALRDGGYEVLGPEELRGRGYFPRTSTTMKAQLGAALTFGARVRAHYVVTGVLDAEQLTLGVIDVTQRKVVGGHRVPAGALDSGWAHAVIGKLAGMLGEAPRKEVQAPEPKAKEPVVKELAPSEPPPPVQEESGKQEEPPPPVQEESGKQEAVNEKAPEPAAPPASPAPAKPEADEEEGRGPWYTDLVTLSFAGAGAALLVGGAVSGGLAWLDVEALRTGDPAAIQEREALRSSALIKSGVADTLYALGAVVVASGGTYVLLRELGVFDGAPEEAFEESPAVARSEDGL